MDDIYEEIELPVETDSSGRVELFTDGTAKGRCHITFCVDDDVDGVFHPDFVYIPEDNVETCDSNY